MEQQEWNKTETEGDKSENGKKHSWQVKDVPTALL